MKIRGLTHKMKNRVRELGDEWLIIKAGETKKEFLLSPSWHEPKREPYMVWAVKGLDFEEVKK